MEHASGSFSFWDIVCLPKAGYNYNYKPETEEIRDMRMYGYLKEPYKCNKYRTVYKIMIHEIPGTGVYTYYYTDREAVFSSYDSYSDHVETAVEEFADELDERGWIEIDDPLPYCQHDCILPVRVKGRDLGQPQWGHYEILSDGQWVEYHPPMERRSLLRHKASGGTME